MKTKNKTALLSFLLVSISSVLVPSRAAASCSCQTSTGLFGIGLFGIGVETIPPECVAACDVQKAEGSNVAAYQDQSQINSTQQAITMDHKNVTAACASPTSAACTAATNALVNDLQKLAGQTQTLTQDAGAAVQDIKAAQTAETQTAKTDDQKAAADRAAAVKAKDAALQVQGLESNTAPGSPLFADDQKQIQQDQAAEAKDNAQAAKDSAAAAAAQHGDAYLSRPTSYLVQQQTTAQAELQKTYAAQKTAYQNNLANAQADQAAANKNIKKYQASLSLMTPNSQQYNDVANLIREQQNAAAKANKDINTWNGMLGSVGAPPPPPPPAQSGGFNPLQAAEMVVLGPAAPLVIAGAGTALNGAGNLAGAAANTKLASQVDSVAYPAAGAAGGFLGAAGSWIAGTAGSLFNGAKSAVGSAGQFISSELSPATSSAAQPAASGVSYGSASAAPGPGVRTSFSCPSGDGLYCGGRTNLGGDPRNLYRCTRISTPSATGVDFKLVENCARGCTPMPAGVNDRCAN